MRYFFCSFILLVATAVASSATKINMSPLSAPSILFTGAIETEPGRRDIGFDVLPLSSGAIITGSTSFQEGLVDGLLMRVDDKGKILWRKVLGGAGLDLLFSAVPDEKGGFVCVGLNSPSGEPGLKAIDGWILRIDSDGDVTWEFTYGGPGEDRLTAIRKTPEGWIAVGHKEAVGKIQTWLLRIDSKGKELSSWIYNTELPSKGLDVLPLADGGAVFVGSEGNERETSDGFAIRIDAEGKIVWKHTIAGAGLQVGYHLQPFRDGSFLVIGYGAFANRSDHDAYVMRVSADGKVVYHETFGGATNDRATNALILEDNSLIVVGQSQRPAAADEDSGWDMIVYVSDSNGAPVWSARLGGHGVEFGRAVKGDRNNIWIVGHTASETGESNVLMVRMDAGLYQTP